MSREDREPLILMSVWLVAAAASLVAGPRHGIKIWLLEAGPAILALAILIPTFRRFRLTPLA